MRTCRNKTFYPPSPENHDCKVVDERRIKGGYPATVSSQGEASARFRRSTQRNHGCKPMVLHVNFLGLVLFGFFLFATNGLAKDTHPVSPGDVLNNFDDAFAALKDERDSLRQEIESLKQEQQALIDGIKKRLEIAEDQKAKSDEALGAAESKIEDLETEKDKLKNNLDASEGKRDRFQDILSEKEITIGNAQKKDEQMKEQLGETSKSFEKAALKIHQLTDEKEALKNDLVQAKEERQKVIESYNKDIRLIQAQREDLVKQLEMMNAKLKSTQIKFENVVQHEEDSWKKRSAQLQEGQKDKSDVFKESKDEKAAILFSLEKVSDRLKTSETQLKVLQDQLKASETKAQALAYKIFQMDKKMKEMSTNFVSSQKQMSVLTEERNNTLLRLVTAENKLKETQEIIGEWREKFQQADQENQTLRQDIESLKKEISKESEATNTSLEAPKVKMQEAGKSAKPAEEKTNIVPMPAQIPLSVSKPNKNLK